MALAQAIANILQSGLSSLKIKDIGVHTDVGYIALPSPRNFDMQINALGKTDGYGRSIAHNFEMTVKVTCPVARTTATLVKILDDAGKTINELKITLTNGQVISTSLLTSNYQGVGCKWAFHSPASMDEDWTVDFEFHRYLTATDYNAILVTGSAPADGTSTSGDTYKPLGDALATYLTDIAGGGINKLEIGTSYASVVGYTRSGTFDAELLCTRDAAGIDHGYGIKITVAAEIMQTSQAELLQWDDLAKIYATRVTFANGAVCTLATSLGINFSYNVEKDVDGIAYIKYVGTGIIPIASWDGIWSA